METENFESQAETRPCEPWHAPLTTVTTLSKLLALLLFIALPFMGFYLGWKYGLESNFYNNVVVEVPVVVKEKKGSATEAFLASLNFEVATSTVGSDGNTFSIVCQSDENDSTRTPCFALYYSPDFTLIQSEYLGWGILPESVRFIEDVQSYVRFDVLAEFGWSFDQYMFVKSNYSLLNILNCEGGCTKIDENTVVTTPPVGPDVSLEKFKVEDAPLGYPSFSSKSIYAISESDYEAGYRAVMMSEGDPCYACGSPDIELLPDNKLKLTLYRENSEMYYGYETKDVIVDLPK